MLLPTQTYFAFDNELYAEAVRKCKSTRRCFAHNQRAIVYIIIAASVNANALAGRQVQKQGQQHLWTRVSALLLFAGINAVLCIPGGKLHAIRCTAHTGFLISEIRQVLLDLRKVYHTQCYTYTARELRRSLLLVLFNTLQYIKYN